MRKSNVIELAGRDGSQDPLTDMLRTGAQQLIQQADNRTAEHTADVVRNGYLPERELQTTWDLYWSGFQRCAPKQVKRL